MKKVLHGCILLILSLLGTQLYAQVKTISGTVTAAEDKQPLIGVSISVKGSTLGTFTNENGVFNIEVPANSQELEFKYVGYTSQTVPISGTTMDVSLVTDNMQLGEVVVVGYTSKRLSEISSSVSVVSGNNLRDVTSNDVTSMLQGKAPGVIVSSGNAGDPSASPSIVIRGSSSISAGSSPLYVVDGIIGGSANPNDIESVTILKDAAATGLYGSRAANGVVIITTKAGKAGKTEITLNSSVGFNSVDYGNLKMMDSQQLYDFEKTFFPESVFAAERPASILSHNTDWMDLAHRTGITQNYTLAVSGGSDKTQVYVSGNYYKEEGTLNTTGNEKYNLRANLSHALNAKLKLNVKLAGSFRKFSADASGHYGALNGADNNLPFDYPYNPDGSIRVGTESDWLGREHDNFLHGWLYNFDRTKQAAGAADVDLIYKINQNLTFSTYNRASYGNSKRALYYDIRSKYGSGTNGLLNNVFNNNSTLITSNRLQYDKSFGKHNLSAIAVGEAEKNYNDDNNINGLGLPAGITVINAASTISNAGGNTGENAFSKGLIQVDYNYDNRYFAVGSLINESSSRFGANNRSANFYTLAGSWILSNEDFMQDQQLFDLLKVRVSYGSTGNAQIENYQSLGLYSYSLQYGGFSASAPFQLANNDLTWEKAKTTNIGLDIGMFKRISLNVDFYDKTTDALLLDVPLSITSGYSSVIKNIGSVQNRGLEVNLNTDNLTGELKWKTNFNIAFNHNKVLKLYEKGKDIITGNQKVSVGHDLASWYMRKWAGVDPENGNPLWEKITTDNNGNQTVTKINSYNNATLQFVGKGSPDFTGGMNNEFTYKNFSLSFFLNFVSGNKIYNSANENYNSDGAYTEYNSRVLADGTNRWEKAGDIATEPKAIYGGNLLSNKPSSRYLEDGSYIRLRNIKLGYQLPSSLLKSVNISNASIYISGDNLWTGTNYTGADPETVLLPGVVNNAYGSLGHNYPINKKILFGINVEF